MAVLPLTAIFTAPISPRPHTIHLLPDERVILSVQEAADFGNISVNSNHASSECDTLDCDVGKFVMS